MKKCVLSLVMFALSVAPWPASAGVIRGTLHVPAASTLSGTATNAYPGHADAIPGARRATRGQVTDAVIYVDRIPADVESTLAAAKWNAPRLAQKDQTFVPRVVAVAAGSSVDFPNMDPIYHNVFSPSPTRRFDLGKYPKGSSRRVEFRKPGIVNVYCEIHSNMEAFVVVLPNHAFTRPSVTGEFALPDLPAGSYDLHVWHPDLGTQTVTVQVPAEGDVAQSLNY